MNADFFAVLWMNVDCFEVLLVSFTFFKEILCSYVAGVCRAALPIAPYLNFLFHQRPDATYPATSLTTHPSRFQYSPSIHFQAPKI